MMKKAKKMFATALTIIMCFSLLQIGFVASAEGPMATVNIDTAYGSAGSNIEVPVTVTTDDGLHALVVDVTIPTGLTFADGDFASDPDFPCPGLKEGSVFNVAGTPISGTQLRILLENSSLEDVSGTDIELVTLCLAIDGEATAGAKYDIVASLNQAGASDIDENPVSVSFNDGSVIVLDAAPYSPVDEIGYSEGSPKSKYPYGTLTFGTNLADIKASLPSNLTVIEFGTVFFRDSIIDDGDELVIGYKNSAGQSSVYACKTLSAEESVPDIFYAVLRDSGASGDSVSDGYKRTVYAARSYIKCHDSSANKDVTIYGNKVAKSTNQLQIN